MTTITRESIADAILALMRLADVKLNDDDGVLAAAMAITKYAEGGQPECGRCLTCGSECLRGGDGSVVCPYSCGDLTDERKEQLREIASNEYASGSDCDVEIDDKPTFSIGGDGIWVSAWVWVSKELEGEC